MVSLAQNHGLQKVLWRKEWQEDLRYLRPNRSTGVGFLRYAGIRLRGLCGWKSGIRGRWHEPFESDPGCLRSKESLTRR